LLSSEHAPQLGIQITTIWNRATGSANENSETQSLQNKQNFSANGDVLCKR